MADSIQRFSSRVQNYVRCRPSYPADIIGLLEAQSGLTDESVVADIGAGTGMLTRLFLDHGNRVFAIEPNSTMREAAENALADESGFTSIAGTAEATMLPDGCVDLVAAAQAFHWFDRSLARLEFRRILRPAGSVVLIWNDRRTDSTPFMCAYENLMLKFGTDYRTVNHRLITDDELQKFFAGTAPGFASFDNKQIFNFAGLKGRLRSSSYTPDTDHPDFQPMISGLERIFDLHHKDGTVVFEYDTLVYYGKMAMQ